MSSGRSKSTPTRTRRAVFSTSGGEATVLRGYETPNDTRPLREAYVRPKALVPVKATAVLSTQVEVTDADAMEL